MTDPVLSLLGLAQKAGAVKSGEFMTEQAIKERKACLVIVASDASDAARSRFAGQAFRRGVPLAIYGDKEALGQAMGKQFRASCAVTDSGFAQAILKRLEKTGDQAVCTRPAGMEMRLKNSARKSAGGRVGDARLPGIGKSQDVKQDDITGIGERMPNNRYTD